MVCPHHTDRNRGTVYLHPADVPGGYRVEFRSRPMGPGSHPGRRRGARDARRVITYCGGGIAASSDAIVLTLLGHDDIAVYDASLSEWAADPALPMATG